MDLTGSNSILVLPGAVARLVAMPLGMQDLSVLYIFSSRFDHENIFMAILSFPPDSKSNCQLKNALSTGKVPPGGLPRDSVVK